MGVLILWRHAHVSQSRQSCDGEEAMPLDLWSPDHFIQKNYERVRNAKPDEFLPYEEVREKYITEKVEPMLVTYRQSDHDWFADFLDAEESVGILRI